MILWVNMVSEGESKACRSEIAQSQSHYMISRSIWFHKGGYFMSSGCLPSPVALDLMSALTYRMCFESYIKLSELSTIICKCFSKFMCGKLNPQSSRPNRQLGGIRSCTLCLQEGLMLLWPVWVLVLRNNFLQKQTFSDFSCVLLPFVSWPSPPSKEYYRWSFLSDAKLMPMPWLYMPQLPELWKGTFKKLGLWWFVTETQKDNKNIQCAEKKLETNIAFSPLRKHLWNFRSRNGFHEQKTQRRTSISYM